MESPKHHDAPTGIFQGHSTIFGEWTLIMNLALVNADTCYLYSACVAFAPQQGVFVYRYAKQGVTNDYTINRRGFIPMFSFISWTNVIINWYKNDTCGVLNLLWTQHVQLLTGSIEMKQMKGLKFFRCPSLSIFPRGGVNIICLILKGQIFFF